jgi:ribosomal protein S18 acetylase RimI-like enzyme
MLTHLHHLLTKIEIIPFHKRHLADVIALVQASPEIFSDKDIKVLHQELDDYLENPNLIGEKAHVFVIKKDYHIVGVAVFYHERQSKDYYHIKFLAIDPKEHNRGLGKKLMRYVFSRIRHLRGRYVYLETSNERHNEKAKHFYTSLGFKPVGVLPNFYQEPREGRKTPEDCVLYYREL